MKHGKKFLSAIALTLCAATLTACAGTSQKVTFEEYWLEDAGIAPNVSPETVLETLVYDVEFKKASGLNDDYTVDYKNGVYTTKLTLNEGVYRYETSLSIKVTYTVDGQSDTMNDSIVSWVEFKKNAKLQPIKSHKEIVCHSPEGGGATIETCYKKHDYTVDTTYNENGLGGKSVIVNNDSDNNSDTTEKVTLPKTFTVEDKYTCLDNEQLLFALRGLSQSTSTASVSVYAPFPGVVQTINVGYSSLEKGTEFTFEKNGVSKEQVINYYPVSVKINAQLPGATQSVWIAETTNAHSNTFRNLILRLETPLSYNLGSLIYKLKSANFV